MYHSGTVYDCIRDGYRFDFHLLKLNLCYCLTLTTKQSALGDSWKTECLNTRLPLPAPQYAGYNMKLNVTKIYMKKYI